MPYGTVSAIIITITGIADNFICCNFVFLFLYLSFKIKVQKNSIIKAIILFRTYTINIL